MSGADLTKPPGEGWVLGCALFSRGTTRDYWRPSGEIARVSHLGISFCWGGVYDDEQEEQEALLEWERRVVRILADADMNGCVYEGRPLPRGPRWPAPPSFPGVWACVEYHNEIGAHWAPLSAASDMWVLAFHRRAQRFLLDARSERG